MGSPPGIQTGVLPITLRHLEVDDAPGLLDLRVRNRDFFEPFEPCHDDSFYTLEAQRAQIGLDLQRREADLGYVLGTFSSDGRLIGWVSLSQVFRRAFQNAVMGYAIDRAHNGRGYATEAVRGTLRFAFEELGLHRVQASVMPRNLASVRVLEKAGFRYEGLARRYLQINGAWEDHRLFAITAEEWA
ncbi:MAG: GNAT family N-acetyltransferase [Actinomycetota bacterium]